MIHYEIVRTGLAASFIACLAAPGATSMFGQEAAQNAPEILRVTRESVLPGKEVEHARVTTQRSRYLASVQRPTVSIALRPITGPGEVLFLTGYKSLEDWGHDRSDIEKTPALKAKLEQFASKAGELLSQRRDISADFEEEISYRSKYDWSKMRYLDVITILLRPGHGDEYLENRKIVIEAHTKAAVDEHMLIYQVSSGRPGTTFLIIRPVETFGGLNLEKAHGDRYMKILGKENREKLHQLFAASVDTQEEEFYAVDPAMSYVTANWAGANKDFWLAR